MTHSPFKLLDSFEKNERSAFFEREDEIRTVYNYIHESNIVLVNGPLGTGKSSIIKCGLANCFEKTDWLEIFVRRYDDINISLRKEINIKNKKDFPLDADILDCLRSLYFDFFKPVYLIFDQFEEIFILGNTEEQETFFKDLRRLLDARDIPCKVIFIMRERYIAQLQKYESIVPEIFDKRVLIERMTDKDIKNVINKSCEHFDIETDDATVDGIVRNLKIDENLIELPHLQIYLDRLWHKAPGPRKSFGSGLLAEVGNIQNVLKQFLEERIEKTILEVSAEYESVNYNTVRDVLYCFVSDEGTKRPQKMEDVISKAAPLDIATAIVKSLANKNILRLDKYGKNEADSIYEIAHDSLAKIIYDKFSLENSHIARTIKTIKNAYLKYEQSNRIWFLRSYLDRNDLRDIKRSTKDIRENVALSKQPTKEEWKFVADSKRRLATIYGLSYAVGAAFILIVLTFLTVWGSEKSTRYRLLINLAKSKTQQYILYKQYEENSILPGLFGDAMFEEIKRYPEHENLYFASIFNVEPITDMAIAHVGGGKKLIIITGPNTVSLYNERFGTLENRYNLVRRGWNKARSNHGIGVAVNSHDTTLVRVTYNSGKMLMMKRVIDSISDGESFRLTSDGILSDSTQSLYDIDNEYNYNSLRRFPHDSMIAISDNKMGISRLFWTGNKKIEPSSRLLPETKVRFLLPLDAEDLEHLRRNSSISAKEDLWTYLENEYLTSIDRLSGSFFMSGNSGSLANLKSILEALVRQVEGRDNFELWMKLSRKINADGNQGLTDVYLAVRGNLERKVQKLREDERNTLFSFVRAQSKRYASDDHILFFEDMQEKLPNDPCLNHYLSIVYNNASWYRLFDGNFKKSIEYAKKGTAVAVTPKSRLDYMYVNLAHAYLLSGNIAEARRYYQQYAATRNSDEENCAYMEGTGYNRDAMIDDLQTFSGKKIIPDSLKNDVASIINMLNAIELPDSDD
ncbi:ATP-binding protein [Dyadobacter sp. CY261]|uniref:ATP-binding protein n=1 Tax=Dyadobacter sp. CY261 TaxID=2907203 RepID=UPI001F1DA00B|nr:ATP-binding protein [Dyadobacter sp. CY261]MCF0069578.1 ATP-binding protein [Dyadobacter sp. CY261]